MASSVQIDLDALAQPVSEAQPAGPDLREDEANGALFLELKDARRSARAAERTLANAELGTVEAESTEARAIDEAREASAGAWRRILELAPRLLAGKSEGPRGHGLLDRSPDARPRLRGPARRFASATRVLVETFWDGLYPLPDAEDGVAARVAPLANLNGEGPDGPLPSRIALLPLTDAIDERGGFSTWHYGQARDLARDRRLGTARAERERAGAVGMESFEAAVAATCDRNAQRHAGRHRRSAVGVGGALPRDRGGLPVTRRRRRRCAMHFRPRSLRCDLPRKTRLRKKVRRLTPLMRLELRP
jgi:type VI secretion system protein ImpA